MAKTFEVALWARFLVNPRPFDLREDIAGGVEPAGTCNEDTLADLTVNDE